jgi:hypothetical protein
MAKKVRDTIHGYVYLTKVEEVVSQHPLFLRLHDVHQTSFTYLTYPNAHSTRYPHSLGVMHVAGEILSAALRSSGPVPRAALVAGVKRTLDHLRSQPGFGRHFPEEKHPTLYRDAQLRAAIVDEAKDRHLFSEPMFAAIAGGIDEDSVLLTLLFQAVRLAALLHDVGHPPYSHIVEYALLDSVGGRYPGHEPKGLELVDAMLAGDQFVERSTFKSQKLFFMLSLLLARYILEPNKDSPFYGIKKSLLDGPIDADRLDYVLRDAYSAGLVPRYDIRRLVDAAFLRKCDKAHFEIGYQPNCLSAFENFFIARYDLYRWMIYHHDVVRRNLCVQRALKILLSSENLRDTLKRLGNEIKEAAVGPASGYRRFNDSFFLERFWSIYENLETSSASGQQLLEEATLKFYLDVVLGRRNDRLRTLLKRPDDYNAFVGPLLKGQNDAPPAVPEAVRRFHKKLSERFNQVVTDAGGNANVAKVRFAAAIEESVMAELNRVPQLKKFAIYAYYLGTFQAGVDKASGLRKKGEHADAPMYFSSPGKDGERISVRSLSPTLTMLQQAWSYSPQLLLYYSPPEGEPADDELKAMLQSVASAGIRNYLGMSA